MERHEGHGGELIAEALRAHGIDTIYTLIGGHIFPMLDGADRRGLRIFEVRHESAAVFAAEAEGKLTRRPGVAVLDAGPGTFNGLNGIVSAQFHGSPLLLVGGRAPRALWGRGPLQDVDHEPVLVPITKYAATVTEPGDIAARVADALAAASSRHRGPAYVQFALDALFTPTSAEIAPAATAAEAPLESEGDPVSLLAAAQKPAILLGSDVWADGAEKAARDMAERLGVPVFMNGMGRGTLPADHPLAFSAARSFAFRNADLVVVIGTPLDFRLNYGGFGSAKVVHVADHPDQVGRIANPAAWLAGPLAAACETLAGAAGADRSAWVAEVRAAEDAARAKFEVDLRSDAFPIHPSRVYGELVPLLPRDAIIVADGGDFTSYAGKYVDVYEQGGWLDPGPYGCLGTSPGYALAAAARYPDRRIVVLLGDGAAGFSLGDWDTLVRYGVRVTLVCGNNGVWGLEKEPMRQLYSSTVGTSLRAGTRYDEIMRTLGGHGELVERPDEIAPALRRALAFDGPAVVNVLTDPDVAYPRSAK